MRLTLKALRVNKQLTQAEASKKLGISEYTLNNYENFKSYPDVPIILKILSLYKVDFDDVIFLPQDCNLIANSQNKGE